MLHDPMFWFMIGGVVTLLVSHVAISHAISAVVQDAVEGRYQSLDLQEVDLAPEDVVVCGGGDPSVGMFCCGKLVDIFMSGSWGRAEGVSGVCAG